MDAIDVQQLNRLIESITEMIRQLHNHSSLETCRRIDDSFYLQKIAELRLLGDQLAQARERVDLLQQRADIHYRLVYCKWKNDAHWLNAYIRSLQVF